jgi:hypothetical protein
MPAKRILEDIPHEATEFLDQLDKRLDEFNKALP